MHASLITDQIGSTLLPYSPTPTPLLPSSPTPLTLLLPSSPPPLLSSSPPLLSFVVLPSSISLFPLVTCSIWNWYIHRKLIVATGVNEVALGIGVKNNLKSTKVNHSKSESRKVNESQQLELTSERCIRSQREFTRSTVNVSYRSSMSVNASPQHAFCIPSCFLTSSPL